MGKNQAALGLALAVCAGACNDEYGELYDPAPGGDPFFTAAEWEVIQSLGPLPDVAPPEPTNKYADDPDAMILGHKLFFDRGYATVHVNEADMVAGSTGIVGAPRNCADCHVPNNLFQKHVPAREKKANTPTIINAAFYDWYGWDGRRDSMWSMTFVPAEGGPLASTRVQIAKRINDGYRDEYEKIFDEPADWPDLSDADRFPDGAKPCSIEKLKPDAPDDEKVACQSADSLWDAMSDSDQDDVNWIYANFGKALEAYERQLIVANSQFDRYVAGEHDQLDEQEKRGLRLFIGKAGCVQCHKGKTLTDNEFHHLGVEQAPDEGEGRCTGAPEVAGYQFNAMSPFSNCVDPLTCARAARLDALETPECGNDNRDMFRTKQLRDVARTGRYMHAGQLGTLTQVVEFYDRGGGAARSAATKDERLRPLHLDDMYVEDLVAFLETLTGDESVLGPLLLPP